MTSEIKSAKRSGVISRKVKLLRAHGECLGNRTDEGRGDLRKAMVSWKQAKTHRYPNEGTQ
jgi:hypothetical protein